MKKLGKIVLSGLLVALVAACGGRETHFMTDKAYREAVHADFEARMAANDSALARVVEIPGQAGDDKAVRQAGDGEVVRQTGDGEAVMAGSDRPSLNRAGASSIHLQTASSETNVVRK